MKPIGVLKALGASLLDLLVPRRCAGCQGTRLESREGRWCGSCLEQLPWIRSPLCPVCGRPYFDSPSSSDHICGDCLLLPPPFDGARSAALYSGIVRKRIHEVKFGGRLHWIPPLVELLLICWQDWNVAGLDGLVAVPLHVKRVQQRGFNQAALMTELLGKRLSLPVCHDALVRSRWTEPQTRLKREERLKNVAHAFTAGDRSSVRDRTLLLIDDVLTTGTTVAACVDALKGAGASRVYVLTVARSVPGWKPLEP
ncbi:MAG: double zinc ribbon domain-containing protein [Syntrophobacteraceae bacterium]